MFLNRPAELIEQRLTALQPQIEAACQAHAAINSSQSAPEVLSIAEQVTAMARQALAHDRICDGQVCEFHTSLDALMHRADRLLREARDRAIRALQPGSRGPHISAAQNNEAYGNVATLEGFVGTVKSLAYYSLSAALLCSDTVADPPA